jgi:hypothetical protein
MNNVYEYILLYFAYIVFVGISYYLLKNDMNNIQKRFYVFLFICIVTRITLTLIAKNINKDYLPYMSIFGFIAGIGIIYIYFFGSNKAESQLQWADGKVWWQCLRIVHGLLYLSFGIVALLSLNEKYKQDNKAWVFLALDTLVGLISFLNYHCKIGNFKKL